MNKNMHDQKALESELSQTLGENPTIRWISQNGANLVWVLLGIIIAGLLVYRLLGGSSASTQDFLQAEASYRSLVKDHDADKQQQALTTLASILKSAPTLQSKYDGMVAQVLLNRGKVSEAQPYIERTLARTSNDDTPYFADYSNTTLTIGNEAYAEALTQAQALDNQLTEENAPILKAYNLLRIAMLQQQLGNKPGELQAWEKFRPYSPYTALVEGKVSINQYVQARIEELK